MAAKSARKLASSTAATPAPTRPESRRTPTAATPATATDLDRLIHDRIRLGILSALAASDALSFTELRDTLEVTDGNLSVHARKLEEAGYVSCRKGFDGRTPRTEFALTTAGRRALERYLDHMDAIIRAARRQDR